MVSGSDDQCVRFWDVQTGKLQHVFPDLDDYVHGVVSSRTVPHGWDLLAAMESDTIKVRSVFTGRAFETLNGVSEVVEAAVGEGIDSIDQESIYLRDIAMTLAGDKLAAAVRSDTGSAVALWEGPKFNKTSLLLEDQKSGGLIRCVTLSPNGDLLASSVGPAITV